MRTFIILLTLSIAFVFCENTISKYSIEGMRCSVNCCNKVKEAFNGVDGVNKCDVNFDTKVATISYDNSKIDQKGIENVIKDKTSFWYPTNLKFSFNPNNPTGINLYNASSVVVDE